MKMFRFCTSCIRLSKNLTPSFNCKGMCYHGNRKGESASNYTIDLRSDTATQPTSAMREAMAQAKVGDDIFGEDPTVNELTRRCAQMFGMEDALIVPSGTMGNLIAVMIQCHSRLVEAIVGDKSHLFLYEVGGMAQLAGIQSNPIRNLTDGTFDLEDLTRHIRPLNDVHQPWTQLICLENTHNLCGGKVLPLSYLKEVRQIANNNNLKVHLDGARIFNAAATLGVPTGDITQHCDSLSTCFSKGLGAPVGSVLVGSKDFISMAQRLRKALGGGMRKPGVQAAAMLVSLDTIVPRLKEDHEKAQRIAKAIMNPSNKAAVVDVEGVHSNIVMVDIKTSVTPTDFSARMNTVTEKEESELGESISVLMFPFTETAVRLVTYHNLSEEDITKTIKKFQYVLKEMSI